MTLTGSGGCGKTRLAVEVAGDVASRFSDGAWWVDLQGVSGPGLVTAAIAGAVEVHERPGQALSDTLTEELRARRLFGLGPYRGPGRGPDGEAVPRALVESNFLPSDDPHRRRHIVETMCAVPLATAAAMFRAATAWNGVGALRLCSAPVLVLLSATGRSNDPARLRAVKPDVQIGVTVGAGHFHQLEVPEQVTAMIERFLAVAVDGRSWDGLA